MPDWRDRLGEILAPLPTEEGGVLVVMATSGVPPAMAMLSSGDVLVEQDVVRVGVVGTSSVVARLGGAFSLLVSAESAGIRVEVLDASATRSGDLAMIEGRLNEVRPTTEPPWLTEQRFRPSHPAAAAIPAHLLYWSAVREWLSGRRAEAPSPPSQINVDLPG